MLRLAANLSFMFIEVPFPLRFRAAAMAGFKGVEFLFPYEHAPTKIAWLVADAGVELVLYNLPPGDWAAGDRGLAAVPGRQHEFRASVETALSHAAVTGLRRMHIMAGCIAADDRAAAEEVYLENLTHAANRLADEGITALVEPINTKDMPGYFLNHTDHAVRLIREVGAHNLRLQFDCYHRAIMDGAVVAGLESSIAEIGHIQIASVPDRHEPDHGSCDYPAVFAALDRLGYNGWIGCEYHPRAKTEDGLGWRPPA